MLIIPNIGLKLSLAKRYVEYIDLTKSNILLEVKKTVQHSIVDEIFGEFRRSLLNLRQKAYASDDLESVTIINKILDDMFCD